MKTLSIRQPWASLIVEGFKDVENRSWRTPIRGEIAIHASASKTEDDWEDAIDYYDLDIEFFTPAIRDVFSAKMHRLNASRVMGFAKNFAKCVGIDPLECLKRNIAKLADRQERGVIKGNGDER